MIARKEELALLREIMEAEWPDENDYLKAMFKQVVDCLGRRDSYLVAVKLGGAFVPFGPIHGLTQAKKLGGRFAGELRTEAFIQVMRAPEMLEDLDLKERNTSV